ncbi:unnamed protein product [Owenia fusiformis]|uniref:UDP-glucuronosyltransferase n=1 Tax=Owenia fusiformis TaxID=6347 RepID=A0A8J1UMV8_OWEFU|nr:unnamed protein product [Owenia fusiformis]
MALIIHLVCCLWILIASVDGGSVLVQPCFMLQNSRLEAIEKIALILSNAGHNVTYFAHTEYKVPVDFVAAKINVIKFKYPSEKIAYNVPEDIVQDAMTTTITGEIKMMYERGGVTDTYLDTLLLPYFEDVSLWKRLKDAAFDLVVLDSVDVILGGIAKQYLDRPTVLWSNAGYEMHFENWLMPLPLAHIPIVAVPFSDHMSFTERTMNVYYYLTMIWYKRNWYDLRDENWKKVADKLGLPPTTNSRLSEGDLIFIQSNFAYFYPRPIMPNVIPVLGLKDKPHKPIDTKFTELIDVAGEDGFIVFTLGSMPAGMDEQRREIFATVFAKLKQRVFWKYSGPIPKSLGKNTILLPWLPQNDLLGHPKLKLFMTHCGASGSAEAVFNGVPIIGVPLFYDQRHHCTILTQRLKMGVVVKFTEITVEMLSNAMDEVIGNPQYKRNALKAQELARDQPVNASYTIQYWAEYVMKHKGAKHLQSKPMMELNFFQYYLLDIACVCLIFMSFTILCVLYLIKRFYNYVFLSYDKKLKKQ